MPCIYKITNTINGKVYIGQTRRTLAVRWNQHKTCSRTYGFPLYAAMRKYGVENFICECLQECTAEELDALEIYWMNHFNAYEKGYNAKAGGSGNYDGIKINGNQLRKKKVKQYTLDGKFIKEYDGLNEAARKTDININRIVACCKHRQHQAYGFQWCYVGDEKFVVNNLRLRTEFEAQKVICFDGVKKVVFESAKSAARFVKGGKHPILDRCKGIIGHKLYKGYYWCYEKDFIS